MSLPGAEILFSDRTGGVSAPPFDSANAGYGRGDDPAAVAENRRRIGAGLGGRATDPEAWTCLHQVHGADVFVTGPPGHSRLPIADASVSTEPEAVLAILTADCAPVALVGPGVVGAVHAGWRGLAAGVIEAAVIRVSELAGEPPSAVVGPCIHPCCYEFSPGDLKLVAQRLGDGVESRTAGGELSLDVPATVRIALSRAGVAEITEIDVCTSCSPRHFSHRRDGRTGLQAMLVAAAPG
ncbi:MAG: polyphenol oxidase family protein, partial [Actinomycetota bacterium]|nr:polyphenol oxidase family protein [Actinomycetota bacterium]